ncbi:MAG TPA: tetratricopeptide repeat protein [Woeseiaceae bacterium]
MRTFSRSFLTLFLLLSVSTAFAGDFEKGWKAYNSGDYALAQAEWQSLADAGDAKACFGMGLLYGNGFGVDMNDELALKYYGIAAGAGHADAQFNLAVMHQNGWGVPLDEKEANRWYRLAADQGHIGAQTALGSYYALDFAEHYDPIEAYKWFSIAAKLGDFDATTKREFLASRMTTEQVIEADGLVSLWLEKRTTLYATKQEEDW